MRTKALSQDSQCVKIPACTPRFKLLCRCFLACFFISNITSPKATAQVFVPSSINTNTTWTAADNPYVANQDVTVEAGITLTIEPGVVVKFGETDSIYVKGDLVANGTSGDDIVFTSLKDDSDGHDTNGDGNASTPAAYDWGGMSFADTCSGSLLNHVVVRYGGREWSSPLWQAVPAIYVGASNLTISSSTITENGDKGVTVYQCDPSIQNNTITNNGGDGIFLDSASPTISGNVIAGNGGYGIFARLSSNPQIMGNSLQDNTRWAIGVDPSASGITIQGNELLGPRAGIFVVAGELTADTVWSSDSVYVVNYLRDSYTMGGLTVNEGTTLTIEPGVVTKFERFARLLVYGNLIAQGTPENQVVFTSLQDDSHGGDTNGDGNITSPAKDDWGGISLRDTCQQGVLNHVIVSYVGRVLCWPNTCNSPAIYVDTPNDVQISNSIITDNGYHGIHTSLGGLTKSNIVIENNTISRNGDYAYGIVLAYGPAEIVRNVISENWRGMYLMNSIGSSIYLNNFVDNTYHNVYSVDSTAAWCSPTQLTYVYNGNTYISYLGNYWDDYTGMDSNGDGIGFPPYSVGVDYDNFPLMMPFENYATPLPTLKWPLAGTIDDRQVMLGFGNIWTWAYCGGLPKKHVGVDLKATTGEYVYAPEAGTVKAMLCDSGHPEWEYCVTIEHSGFTTVCWHIDPLVNVGDTVIIGQVIGTIANLGVNTHLHFGVRASNYSSNVSNVGALPQTDCDGYPAFPEQFVDPMTIAYEITQSLLPPEVTPRPEQENPQPAPIAFDTPLVIFPVEPPSWYGEETWRGVLIRLLDRFLGFFFPRYFKMIIDPTIFLIPIEIEGVQAHNWKGDNATAVTVAVAGTNQTQTDAIKLTEASDAFIWKEVTIPENAYGLTFDAIFLSEPNGGNLIVSFDEKTLFIDDGTLFSNTIWAKPGIIYIGDLAGETGTLQFWLKSEGEPNMSILIDNIVLIKYPKVGDLDGDMDIDQADLAMLCLHWLEQDCNYPDWCEGTDLDYNRSVDFVDFAIFAENWLWKKIPSDLDIDGDVDFADYAILSNQWLQPPAVPFADIAPPGGDDFVDFLDIVVFAEHWLENSIP